MTHLWQSLNPTPCSMPARCRKRWYTKRYEDGRVRVIRKAQAVIDAALGREG